MSGDGADAGAPRRVADALAGPVRISPRTAERRSPRALAHDPPVDRSEWTTTEAQSLERFLASVREHGGWDDEAWERLLRHGGLHLDRRRLELTDPPTQVPAGTHVVVHAFAAEPATLELASRAVVHDAGGLVAIDKPPWFAVQGTRASRLASLERAARALLACPTLTAIHRLDRETTGVILFARSSDVAAEIGRQFATSEVRKEYLAVTWPTPRAASESDLGAQAWDVAGVLCRVPHPSHSLFELRTGGETEGRWSRTRFELVATQGDLALVRALPLTGRTHQLRVHLAAGGTPIVGDSLYGRGWWPGQPWSAERMQLHARSLTFRFGGREMTLSAPVPADFILR